MEASTSRLYEKAVPMQLLLQYCTFHNTANAVIHLARLHDPFRGEDKPLLWKKEIPFSFCLGSHLEIAADM